MKFVPEGRRPGEAGPGERRFLGFRLAVRPRSGGRTGGAGDVRELCAAGEIPQCLCVCSDDEVAKEARDVLTTEHDSVWRVSDEDDLVDHLRRMKSSKGVSVVVTTYQSSTRLGAAARRAGVGFDFGVLDEAHRTVALPDQAFAHLLHDQNLRIDRRLFMTATPRTYRGKKAVGMDDEGVYGPRVVRMTFAEAIEKGILCDYTVVAYFVTHAEHRRLLRERRYVATPEDSRAASSELAAAALVERLIERLGARRVVTFHSNVGKAKALKARLERRSGRVVCHISTHDPAGERQANLRKFKEAAGASVITNARCLVEGVDIPAVDAIVFCDPSDSRTQIIQSGGRALRQHDGKPRAYVAVAVAVDEGASAEEAFRGTAFAGLVAVLRALAAHDERVLEDVLAVAEGRAPTSERLHIEGEVAAAFDLIDPVELNRRLHLQLYERARDLAPLSEGLILEAIKLFRDQSGGRFPTQRTPGFPTAVAPSWALVNEALSKGHRGLPGGSSLAELIGRAFPDERPEKDLDERLVREWVQRWHEDCGEFPTRDSGRVPYTEGETWSAVDRALRDGLRRLNGGSTLAKLVDDIRGRTTRKLTLELVETWVRRFIEANGRPPTKRDAELGLPVGENWGAIDAALRRGTRELPGGESLREVVDRLSDRPSALTPRLILGWMREFRRLEGEWPTTTSGSDHLPAGEKWANLNERLAKGGRGLPGGSSLKQLRESVLARKARA